MFKLVAFATLICAARAGVIPVVGVGHGVVDVGHGVVGLSGLGGLGGLGHSVVAAPIAVKTAVATSYQNNNQISVHPTAVVAHAPVAVAHAPIAVAHAPVAVAHAPIAVAAPVAVGVKTIGIGGLGGIGLRGWDDGLGLKGGY